VNGPGRALIGLLAIVMLASPARGQEPGGSEYMRQSWTEKDGLPGSAIGAMAQDGDGYLWLISSGGLVRFDGVRFVDWNATDVGGGQRLGASTLSTALDGSLLIGLGNGGVARLQNGKLTIHQPEEGGLPPVAVRSVIEDHEHTIWAGGQGVTRFRSGRWEHVGRDRGLPDDPVYSLFEDHDGNLWVGTAAGVFRRASGADRFDLVRDVRALGFADDPRGQVWMTGLDHPFRTADGHGPEVLPPALLQTASGGWRLRRDSRGNIWVATLGAGVWRVHALESPGPPRIEEFDRDRLSNAVVRSVVEDREGNIWVGTDYGLNRLTPTALRSQQSELGKINKPVVAVAAEKTGDVWVGTQTGLYRFSAKGGARYDQRNGLPGVAIYSLHIDRQGTLWAAGDQLGVVRREKNGRFTAIPLPGLPLRIIAMTADWSGGLYLCDLDLGVFLWKNGVLTEITKDKTPKAAYAAITDREGRVWLGMAGQIMRFDPDGSSRTFGPDDGLGRGAVQTLFEDKEGVVWAGGTPGLSRFTNGRFTVMPVEGNGRRQNVVAVAEDGEGNLWLGVRSGVMRVPRRDVDAAAANPSRPIQQPLYDMDDGLNGLPIWLGYPTVTRGGDGRLWFVTSDGVSAFDPRLISKHRLAPPVQIESIAADDKPVALDDREGLPPLTSRLQIDYTGISFTVPSKVLFRYKLEGFDADWVDAGTRRQAFYTNLPPRSYRFHVIAGNDGVWNNTGAALTFAILPAFYQTVWFRIVVLATIAFAAWGAWRLRVRHVREQFDMVLAERARMAREIHDTLLQSLVGVTLQFDTLGSEIESSASPLRREFDKLRKQLEQCIREARQSILDLRTPAPGEGDLAAAIRQVVEKQTSDSAVTVDLAIVGTPRPSGPRITQQLLRIAQEAVNNAMRHADATRIRIELCYDAATVALRVSDNGRGFDPARPVFTPEDHWGLANMKERADQIGAQFRLTSSPGAGTEIETVVSTASSA